MKKFLVLVASLNLACLVVSQHPSPCPEIFQYEKTEAEPGKWTGTLVLDTEYPLSGTWIRVVLDRKIDEVEVSPSTCSELPLCRNSKN